MERLEGALRFARCRGVLQRAMTHNPTSAELMQARALRCAALCCAAQLPGKARRAPGKAARAGYLCGAREPLPQGRSRRQLCACGGERRGRPAGLGSSWLLAPATPPRRALPPYLLDPAPRAGLGPDGAAARQLPCGGEAAGTVCPGGSGAQPARAALEASAGGAGQRGGRTSRADLHPRQLGQRLRAGRPAVGPPALPGRLQ